jgi:thioredoxin-like negative regulator of GroEL
VLSFSLAVLLQVAAIPGAQPSYAAAHKLTAESGKPLVVLVGADWCPACRTMKQSVLPRLAREGGLSDVAFVTVDVDHESSLARKLMRGSSMPQLIMYTTTQKGWQRHELRGAQSPEAIARFLDQGVDESHVAARPKETEAH